MVWVFGYGSLVWKVGFPYRRKKIGYINGYIRRFWWWSMDHRGVPDSPGRVVNLIKTNENNDKVWGVAYEIDDELWQAEVEKQLDHRERGGYAQAVGTFHAEDTNDSTIQVIFYIGNMSHTQYAGPAPIEEIAETILRSVGPSGSNIDYLYELAEFMRDVDPNDNHLKDLVREVKRLESSQPNSE